MVLTLTTQDLLDTQDEIICCGLTKDFVDLVKYGAGPHIPSRTTRLLTMTGLYGFL